jgi:hypothetical protein
MPIHSAHAPTSPIVGPVNMPLPDEARHAARAAEYRNAQEERENITAIDRAVFDKIALHERHLVGNAKVLQETADVTASILEEIETNLREEIREHLNGGGVADNATLERFSALRGYARQAIADLERADRDAEWLLGKLDDPTASYTHILSKFPSLRVGHSLLPLG